ncbi:MAG: hybrid sensor histidine kinase/response regulator, partial [Spirochaetaceae bacterium]|nr:hybrid sensor histidine kinase/response regulator [Spirochaetaceae bacterium]
KAQEIMPDVIISDLMMPGMDGIELCKRLKANPKLRESFFIMLTAKSRTEDKIKGFGSGADDYMTKPFNHQELLARVHSAMRIRNLQKELSKLSELKDEFLGIAAHDMRTPLTVIKGWSDLFLEGMLGDLNSEQSEAIESISQQVRTMLELINDLLDVTKIESGKVQLNLGKHKIQDVIDQHWKSYSLLATKKAITLHKEVHDDLPEIPLDKERISQVLNNLLSNAFKFSPRGSLITVSAELCEDGITVAVMDTGVGIPEEAMHKMFKKFSQAGPRATEGEKGTGLGLAIVKKIVEMHEGTVGVKSKVGEGSTFSFTRPFENKCDLNKKSTFVEDAI